MESTALRILFLEDSELDADAVRRLLKKAGYVVENDRVDSEEGFRDALQRGNWDAVIADYHLPAWTALEALQVFKTYGLDIPFIIVSGLIDEETAVAAMKSGAQDFITKGRLARLVPAIERELAETSIRKAQRRAERDRTLLAEAGRLFAMPIDHEGTLAGLARIVVGAFADWCVIDVADKSGGLLRSQIAHADPAKQELVEKLRDYQPPEAQTRVMEVFHTGVPRVVSHVDKAMLAGTTTEEQKELLKTIGCSSYISVPLVAGGVVLGVLTLCYSDPAMHYGSLDLDLAVELARRAAIVIENARLFQQANQANRLKDQFLAMVSHELRTPLTPILGAVQMIKASSGNPEVLRKAVELIERNARMQAQIVDDLLDISRIVSGKLNLRAIPVDLDSVVRSALDTVATTLSASQFQLETSLCQVRGIVLGDASRLEQVLGNLLSNALKFTQPGGKITVSLEQPSSSSVRISVIDTGKGIDPEFLPHVFDRFRQADASSTRAAGGLGLGLAITRDLVELHGGEIRALSAGLGKGASFVVDLPIHQRDSEDPALSVGLPGSSASI